MDKKTYYDILGVSANASSEEITSAKNMLAKKYHPDVNIRLGIDTTRQMQEVLEAWQVLSDPDRRAQYDRSISGQKPHMQTFDLHETEETSEHEESGFIVYWRASGKLYEIISESNLLFRQKDITSRLTKLAMQAIPYILLLREAKIPERYWHPDIMNWLLFASYKNRNYTIEYLLTLYDEHTKKDLSALSGLKLRNQTARYEYSIKRLMKY